MPKREKEEYDSPAQETDWPAQEQQPSDHAAQVLSIDSRHQSPDKQRRLLALRVQLEATSRVIIISILLVLEC